MSLPGLWQRGAILANSECGHEVARPPFHYLRVVVLQL